MKGIIKAKKKRGQEWSAAVADAKAKVKDGASYFIRRDGGWFRPNAHGYTVEIGDAGLFSGIDAQGYLQAEGVALYPLTIMRADIERELLATAQRAGRLAKFTSHLGSERQ